MKSEHIINYVCNDFGITKEQLLSTSRKTHLVDARQTCSFALRELGFTYKKIADDLGYKDHAIIIHLVRDRHHNSLENQRSALRAVMSYRDMTLLEKMAINENMKAKSARTKKFLPWEQ
jgi:chromosomal replication initiation ATPase DnaA